VEPRCFVAAFDDKRLLLAVAVPEQLAHDEERPVAAGEDGVDRVALAPLRCCRGS
jgi:hypothetical protein